MATQIFEQSISSKTWDEEIQKATRLLYSRKIGPTAGSTIPAISRATSTFKFKAWSTSKRQELDWIEATDTIIIDLSREIDMKTFSDQFYPRLQQLLVAKQLQTKTATKIQADIANFCRGALNNYQQLQERTVKKMELVVTTLTDEFEQQLIQSYNQMINNAITQNISKGQYDVSIVFTVAWKNPSKELIKMLEEMNNQAKDGIQAVRLKINNSKENDIKRAANWNYLRSP